MLKLKNNQFTEIVPAEKLKSAFQSREDKYFVVQRAGDRITLAGLGDYLENLGGGKKNLGFLAENPR